MESKDHILNSIEIFYILSGELGPKENGKQHLIKPGTVAISSPGDKIIHTVSSETPVRALAICLPGGESDKLIEKFGYKVLPFTIEENDKNGKDK